MVGLAVPDLLIVDLAQHQLQLPYPGFVLQVVRGNGFRVMLDKSGEHANLMPEGLFNQVVLKSKDSLYLDIAPP